MMFVDGVDTHRIGFVPEDVFAWTRLELWKIEEAMGINGFVGKKRLDVQDFVETGFKCQDQSRIELTAGFSTMYVRTFSTPQAGLYRRLMVSASNTSAMAQIRPNRGMASPASRSRQTSPS